jgi:hypothetical protein
MSLRRGRTSVSGSKTIVGMGEINVRLWLLYICLARATILALMSAHTHTHPSPRNGELPMPSLCLPSSRSRQRPSHRLRAHSSCNYSGDRTEAKSQIYELTYEITRVPLAAMRNHPYLETHGHYRTKTSSWLHQLMRVRSDRAQTHETLILRISICSVPRTREASQLSTKRISAAPGC